MRRRALLSLFAFGFAAPAIAATEEARARRVVYHIDSVDKVPMALGNMRNHRAGGPDGLKLAAVVIGPALGVFRAGTDNQQLRQSLAAALQRGDEFFACANTLSAHQWTLADILQGFALAENGGVVKLADMQAQGWIYLRP